MDRCWERQGLTTFPWLALNSWTQGTLYLSSLLAGSSCVPWQCKNAVLQLYNGLRVAWANGKPEQHAKTHDTISNNMTADVYQAAADWVRHTFVGAGRADTMSCTALYTSTMTRNTVRIEKNSKLLAWGKFVVNQKQTKRKTFVGFSQKRNYDYTTEKA